MFDKIILLVVFDLSPHGVGLASGSVANIAITIDYGIEYFLIFRSFGAFLGGGVIVKRCKTKGFVRFFAFTRCVVVKNSAASNFYEMRRNLNFMARSFREMPTRFSAMHSKIFAMRILVLGLRGKTSDLRGNTFV